MADINWLELNSFEFPEICSALSEPNGLLAVGGDLSINRLLEAYRRGIFPWYEKDQPILWWSPDPRSVLYPEHLYVSRSLRKALSRGTYDIRYDQTFAEVIKACAAPRSKANGTWITQEMYQAFNELHAVGVAHSVETWRDGKLAGGLYGIAMGNIFFGESMFSREPDASKIALFHLVEKLKADGFTLIDCQVHSEHLASMGAIEIPRTEFNTHLREAILDPLASNWRQ
jgi:leucyl/phenylalanyl-tRNA--protein transferase